MQTQPLDKSNSQADDDLGTIDAMTDQTVGRHIRLARLAKSLSLRELAEQLGISLQQLQRYEAGSSKISVSILWKIAKRLKYPVSYFYGSGKFSTSVETPSRQRELEQLFCVFHRIEEPHLRRAVIELATQLSKP